MCEFGRLRQSRGAAGKLENGRVDGGIDRHSRRLCPTLGNHLRQPENVGSGWDVPQQAPVQPVYTPPKPVYQTPVQQAPVQQAPVQQAPAQPAFPIRTSHVPAGGSRSTGGNSFSPPVTRARGS